MALDHFNGRTGGETWINSMRMISSIVVPEFGHFTLHDFKCGFDFMEDQKFSADFKCNKNIFITRTVVK